MNAIVRSQLRNSILTLSVSSPPKFRDSRNRFLALPYWPASVSRVCTEPYEDLGDAEVEQPYTKGECLSCSGLIRSVRGSGKFRIGILKICLRNSTLKVLTTSADICHIDLWELATFWCPCSYLLILHHTQQLVLSLHSIPTQCRHRRDKLSVIELCYRIDLFEINKRRRLPSQLATDPCVFHLFPPLSIM